MADGYHNADVLDRMVNLLRSRPIASAPAAEQCPYWKDSYNLVKGDLRDLNIGKFYCAKPMATLADAIRNATLEALFQKANQRQMDVETDDGTIIEVIEKGEVLAWIDELRQQSTEAHHD